MKWIKTTEKQKISRDQIRALNDNAVILVMFEILTEGQRKELYDILKYNNEINNIRGPDTKKNKLCMTDMFIC